MNSVESVSEYCASEYFMFLNPALKEYAEPVLHFWVNELSDPTHLNAVAEALKKCGTLKLPIEIRKEVPTLIGQYYQFLEMTGLFPDIVRWIEVLELKKSGYSSSFREDGSIKGTTHKKNYTDVGRNDPCPCGSGKKFKKCCMNFL